MASKRKRKRRIDSKSLLPVVSMVTESFRARRKRRKRIAKKSDGVIDLKWPKEA